MQPGCKPKITVPLRIGRRADKWRVLGSDTQRSALVASIETKIFAFIKTTQRHMWYMVALASGCSHDRLVLHACMDTSLLLKHPNPHPHLNPPTTFSPYILFLIIIYLSFFFSFFLKKKPSLWWHVLAVTRKLVTFQIKQQQQQHINHGGRQWDAAWWQVLEDETQARRGSIWCWGPPPDGGEGPDRHILMWEKKKQRLAWPPQTAFQSQRALPISSIYYPSAMH